VLGLAKSGLAAIELLLGEGAQVIASDSQPIEDLPEARARLAELGVPFRIQSEEALADAGCVVISPGVPGDLDLLEMVRKRGVPVIGDVELAGQFLQGRNIGITGANGKTTTTALVGHLLRENGIPAQIGGNIGTIPAAAMVKTSRPQQWNVLELSSFQLETIQSFRSHIGVALNVTQDHLDRHHTFEAYAAAKGRMFEKQHAGDTAVLNAGDPVTASYASRTVARPAWFSLNGAVKPGAWLEGGQLWYDGIPFMSAAEVPLRGLHNIENVLAASVAASIAGAPLNGISAAVKTFRAVEHRLEYVATVNGVDFYNDSKATNVDSTLKAIDAFSGGLWVILGGKDKGSDYGPLVGPLLAKAHAACLIGAATPLIAACLSESGLRLLDCGTLENAVATAFSQAVPGDTVLLAPACASFDQFTSYGHRGKVFKQLVARLQAGI
jgi:UDP-N-acetylmuramoylalanine--D-glutamate ligase